MSAEGTTQVGRDQLAFVTKRLIQHNCRFSAAKYYVLLQPNVRQEISG